MSSMHKEDFQIFENFKNNPENKLGSDLVYLDNFSTSQIPNQVLDAMNHYYTNHKSNIDRGLYSLEEISTQKYEEARKKIASFLNVSDDEIILTSGATDSSNKLVMMIEKHLAKYPGLYKTKNEILILNTTHNSDLIPLQEYVKRNNLEVKILKLDNILENISEKTLLISAQLVSNVTGEIFDLKSIFAKAKEVHAFSICDMTSAVGHMSINIKDLDCDAAYFSAHKMCGPTGVGALFIKREYTRNMEPVFFGGNMVSKVNVNNENKNNEYRSDIKLFEAGTQNIAGVIGFGAACDYLNSIGLDNIYNHNQELLKYFYQSLEKEENINIKNNLRIIFQSNNQVDNLNVLSAGLKKNIGIVTFEIKKDIKIDSENRVSVHAHDVAQILSEDNVCVRSGKHCADIFLQEINVTASTRSSFYFYNTKEDIDQLFISLRKVLKKFQV